MGGGGQEFHCKKIINGISACVTYAFLVHLLVQVMYIVQRLRTYSKSKTLAVNSVCTVYMVPVMSRQDTARLPEHVCTPEVCHVQCTEIVTAAVCEWHNFGFCCKLLVGPYWPWIRYPLSHSQVSAVHEGWSFLFRTSVLVEGPSNRSIMARQMTTFGTIVEKVTTFQGLA